MCFILKPVAHTLFRIFFGPEPRLVVADIDMLREILVKRFSNFVDRVSHC